MKMGISFCKISLVFLRIWLLFQFCPKSVATDELAKIGKRNTELNKGNATDLNGRMTHIEIKSHKQEKEIEILKTLLEEERQFSKQLSGRISQLEASSASPASSKTEEFPGRQKRPFRLLPPNIPGKVEEKVNHAEENMVRYYGPPSNCKELSMLGYTLNGYYLVENENGDKIKNQEGVEIELIYCRFQLPPGTEAKMEKRVGFVKIVNKSHSKSSDATSPSKIQEETEQNRYRPNWKSKETSVGKYVYAVDCDFYGSDIDSGPALALHFCSDRCLLNPQCTHFTWNKWRLTSQTCWLKRAPDHKNPLSFPVSYTDGNVCGYLTKRKPVTFSEKILTTERVQEDKYNWKSEETSAGQYVHGVDCDYFEFNIDSLVPALSWQVCSDRCLLNSQCTHFSWGPYFQTHACWVKRAPDATNPLSFPVTYLKGFVCGYVTKRKAAVTSNEKILTTDRVQENPFVWKSVLTSKGQYMFADDCKFKGGKIAMSVADTSHETCREKCLLKKKCTHTTWSYQRGRNLCFTMESPNPEIQFVPAPIHEKGSVCGYFSTNKTI